MSRIIIPANFDVTIEIHYDSKTGQSELHVKKGSVIISMLMMAGILSEHLNGIIKTILTSKQDASKAAKQGETTNA